MQTIGWPVVQPSSSRLAWGSSTLLILTELLPGAEAATVLRITRDMKTNAENKLKISVAEAKRLLWPLLQPLSLGWGPEQLLETSITKSVNSHGKLPLKKEAKTLAAGKVTAKKVAKPLEKAPVPVPEPQLGPETELEPVKEEKLSPEPILVDTLSPSPMETSGCALAEEYLCQAFSDIILAVSEKTEMYPNLCSEYVKDIYAYLRQLQEKQAIKPKYLKGCLET